MSLPQPDYTSLLYAARPWTAGQTLSAERLNRLAAELIGYADTVARGVERTLGILPSGSQANMMDLLTEAHYMSGTNIGKHRRETEAVRVTDPATNAFERPKDVIQWAGVLESFGAYSGLPTGPRSAAIGSSDFFLTTSLKPVVHVRLMRTKWDDITAKMRKVYLDTLAGTWKVDYELIGRADFLGNNVGPYSVVCLAEQFGFDV